MGYSSSLRVANLLFLSLQSATELLLQKTHLDADFFVKEEGEEEEESSDGLNSFRFRLIRPRDLILLISRLTTTTATTAAAASPPPPPYPRVIWLGSVCDPRPLPDPAHDRNFAAYWMNLITAGAATGKSGRIGEEQDILVWYSRMRGISIFLRRC